MIRNALRILLAGVVAVALSLGGTGVANGGVRAAGPDASARAAGECTTQQAHVKKAKSAKHKADRAVKKAKRAKHNAHSAKQKKAATKALTQAKKKQRKAAKALRAARKVLRTCQSQTGGGGGPVPPSPAEQQCLDAGLPAEICAALGQLPVPEPGTGDSPIQALCDQGLPQAICDAATLPSPDGETSPLQPLCDAGLPQAICDATAPGGGDLPLPPELCTLPIPLPICELPLRTTGRAAQESA
jgi:hypothetical protein